MLNIAHPFLKEVIGFCAVILEQIKAGGAEQEDDIRHCHILTDSLVKWS